MSDVLIKQKNSSGYSQFNPVIQDSDISAALNLTSTATNKDWWKWIANYNQYWWKTVTQDKIVGYEEKKQKLYQRTNVWYKWAHKKKGYSIQYSKELIVNTETGAVSLKDPQTYTTADFPLFISDDYAALTEFKALLPCYATNFYKTNTIGSLGTISTDILYIPSDATSNFTTSTSGVQTTTLGGDNQGNNEADYQYYVVGCEAASPQAQLVTSEAVIQPRGDIGYLHSNDKNAYPESGIVDYILYQFLRVPFENIKIGGRIVQGSYIGTGTYGDSANPTSITFEFEPKFVFVAPSSGLLYYGGSYSSFHQYFEWISGVQHATSFNNSSQTYGLTFVQNGNTLSWYLNNYKEATGSAQYEYNTSGTTYYYFAIG